MKNFIQGGCLYGKKAELKGGLGGGGTDVLAGLNVEKHIGIVSISLD